mmetsp:Transcript_11018/g.21005  ORF Transcript_11018/g.21005 Transcript_11018/m.21005 type:complete len:1095 (+) Transcript_11018:49-3333(+)
MACAIGSNHESLNQSTFGWGSSCHLVSCSGAQECTAPQEPCCANRVGACMESNCAQTPLPQRTPLAVARPLMQRRRRVALAADPPQAASPGTAALGKQAIPTVARAECCTPRVPPAAPQGCPKDNASNACCSNAGADSKELQESASGRGRSREPAFASNVARRRSTPTRDSASPAATSASLEVLAQQREAALKRGQEEALCLKDQVVLQQLREHIKEHEINNHDIQFEAEIIGSGGFASVQRCRMQGGFAAAKCFQLRKLEHWQRDALIRIFRSEVEVLLNLHSPRIVQVFGVCTTVPDMLYIIMEYCEQGSVRALLDASLGPLPLDRLWALGEGTAHGMAYLHSKCIVHRDLKSANVLMDAAFKPKVADFGIAREAAKLQSIGTSGSTPWMAPEALQGAAVFASDVYSYGVFVWELSTRRWPWEGLNEDEIRARVCEEDARLPVDGAIQHATLLSLMTSCWWRDISRRPTFPQLAKESGEQMVEVMASETADAAAAAAAAPPSAPAPAPPQSCPWGCQKNCVTLAEVPMADDLPAETPASTAATSAPRTNPKGEEHTAAFLEPLSGEFAAKDTGEAATHSTVLSCQTAGGQTMQASSCTTAAQAECGTAVESTVDCVAPDEAVAGPGSFPNESLLQELSTQETAVHEAPLAAFVPAPAMVARMGSSVPTCGPQMPASLASIEGKEACLSNKEEIPNGMSTMGKDDAEIKDTNKRRLAQRPCRLKGLNSGQANDSAGVLGMLAAASARGDCCPSSAGGKSGRCVATGVNTEPIMVPSEPQQCAAGVAATPSPTPMAATQHAERPSDDAGGVGCGHNPLANATPPEMKPVPPVAHASQQIWRQPREGRSAPPLWQCTPFLRMRTQSPPHVRLHAASPARERGPVRATVTFGQHETHRTSDEFVRPRRHITMSRVPCTSAAPIPAAGSPLGCCGPRRSASSEACLTPVRGPRNCGPCLPVDEWPWQSLPGHCGAALLADELGNTMVPSMGSVGTSSAGSSAHVMAASSHSAKRPIVRPGVHAIGAVNSGWGGNPGASASTFGAVFSAVASPVRSRALVCQTASAVSLGTVGLGPVLPGLAGASASLPMPRPSCAPW